MLNYDVFEAFKAAGVPDDKARKAAEALSGAAEASEVATIRTDVADLKSTVKLHTWMIGAVFALNVAILVRLLIPV